MEALLTAAALVASVFALVLLYRANRYLAALPGGHGAALSGKVASFMVSAGKWLAIAGAAATTPLIATLLIAPEATNLHWTSAAGFAGCLAFALAAMLLVPAGLMNALAHSVRIRHLTGAGARFVLNKALSLARRKAFWLSLAVIAVVAAFLPWVIDLLAFAGYAVLLFAAGRLGLSSNIDQDDSFAFSKEYNYATGKWDNGYDLGGLYDWDCQ